MIERLLYRLSISNYNEKFILKGGLLLYIHLEDRARPTRDVDFLARRIANDAESISKDFQEICKIECDDGLMYDGEHLLSEKIKEDADYEGLRVKIVGYLERSKETLQFDIGFGDVVVPKPVMMEYPVLLDMNCPEIHTYSIESVIAEKFEAMISLALLNSRMKDFYDIFTLSEKFNFDGRVLYEAIFETFQRRGTNLIKQPAVFTEAFLQDNTKRIQWEAFINRTIKQKLDFEVVLARTKFFLEPVYSCILKEKEFFEHWDKENRKWKKA
jgi:predicted nucleotidyltransferase component of viral defense system